MTVWQSFPEQGVELRFAGATVVRWDAHPAFLEGLQRMHGTKAVDFALLAPDDRVVLFELKDFRDHGIENRGRLRGGELAREVADKVRDTLAGMTWACNRPHADAEVTKVTSGFFRRDTSPLLVVLWLDRDDVAQAAEAATLQTAIAAHLRPHIHAKVIVTSLRLRDRALPHRQYGWLEARSLPRTTAP
jgi:hypothetical protein